MSLHQYSVCCIYLPSGDCWANSLLEIDKPVHKPRHAMTITIHTQNDVLFSARWADDKHISLTVTSFCRLFICWLVMNKGASIGWKMIGYQGNLMWSCINYWNYVLSCTCIAEPDYNGWSSPSIHFLCCQSWPYSCESHWRRINPWVYDRQERNYSARNPVISNLQGTRERVRDNEGSR